MLGIADPGTRTKLLETRDLTLEKCTYICRSRESAKSRMKKIDIKGDAVTAVTKKPWPKRTSNRPPPTRKPQGKHFQALKTDATCKYCGNKHEFKKELCPAWGRQCAKCKGRNHFAKMCQRTSPNARVVNLIDQFDEYDDY